MPNTGSYQWTSDIGTSSIPDIQALARSSGVAFTTTSTYRNEPGSWHNYSNAVDMASTTAGMVQLAAYLYQYSPYLLELIHSGGSGFFVKNGQRVTADFYGAQTVSEHYDHVHCAATVSALLAASNGDKVIPAGDGSQIPKTKKLGCLPQAAVILMSGTITLGGIVWTISSHLT